MRSPSAKASAGSCVTIIIVAGNRLRSKGNWRLNFRRKGAHPDAQRVHPKAQPKPCEPAPSPEPPAEVHPPTIGQAAAPVNALSQDNRRLAEPFALRRLDILVKKSAGVPAASAGRKPGFRVHFCWETTRASEKPSPHPCVWAALASLVSRQCLWSPWSVPPNRRSILRSLSYRNRTGPPAPTIRRMRWLGRNPSERGPHLHKSCKPPRERCLPYFPQIRMALKYRYFPGWVKLS